jgi:hypothetical protein
MALDKIVAWEIVGYTNDGQVVNLSECPNDVANVVDSWITELECDNDITESDYLYREHYKKRSK